MNKKYLLLIIGLLLCVSVFLAYQVSQASPAIPNPGHGTSDLEGDASLNMNSNKIINLSTPTAGTDAATKAYVDALTLNCTITSTSSTTFAYATCPAGTTRTGGGCVYALYQDASHYQYNRPVGDDQWECRGYPNYVVVAYIVCCDII